MCFRKSLALSLIFAFFLAGCSGSDGYGVGNGKGSTETEDTTDESETGGDSGDETSEVVLDIGNGTGTSFTSGVATTSLAGGATLTFGASTTISVVVVDTNASNAAYGTPTPVTFTSACATAGLAIIEGSATTSGGVASVNYTATSCQGSDEVTATLASGETASVTFNITDLSLGTGSGDTFTEGVTNTSLGGADLSYGGDALISVNIVDSSDNSLFTANPVEVNFTSTCVQNGLSTIDSSDTATNGTATVTYSAVTCEGTDTITATLADGTTASTTITVAPQVLGSLEFVSATPDTIALMGSGSSVRPEVSQITFILKDNTGSPISGETVSYELSTTSGGITLSNSTSNTAADGTTKINLNAGRNPISVNVTATVTNDSGATIRTTSNPIAIVGGLPDQNSFSLSVDTLNPRGWNFDGSTSTLTIRGADRNNNPAPDGTQVSFITYGGSIVGNCSFDGGVCSVDWTSQDPRPVNYGDGADDIVCNADSSDPRNRRSDDNPGFDDACGLVKILVRTTGEESFQDATPNGLFDVGETIVTPLGEAYNDENDNGQYDFGEYYSDFNENSDFDGTADALFQGTNCSDAAIAAGHCAGLIEVRETATLCMSTDETVMYDDSLSNTAFLSGGTITLGGAARTLVLQFTDAHGLTPASGTNIAASGEEVEILASSVAVPNACNVGGYFGTVTIGPDGDTADGSDATTGSLKITVDQPNGVSRVYLYSIRD